MSESPEMRIAIPQVQPVRFTLRLWLVNSRVGRISQPFCLHNADVAFARVRVLICSTRQFHEISTIRIKVGITKVVSIVSVIALMCGCSSVISNSEAFYKDRPRRPINYREYLSD